MDYIDLGRRIRKQRTLHGWTQEELAERVNVSTSFVGHVERGTRKASLETLVAIANVLDVSLDYLLAASMNNSVIGPMPRGLNTQQRTALKEILSTIQDNLAEWEKDD
ncbi:MAG: helix-turn-helix transcriptional regulator [Eubacteriales bacterium]|nr:helix-turn-helix transcriptional regulator [Eubacteriales bacterium]